MKFNDLAFVLIAVSISSSASATTDCYLSQNSNKSIVVSARNIEQTPRTPLKLMFASFQPIVQVVQVKSDDERYRLVFDDSGIPNGTQVKSEVTIQVWHGGKKVFSLGTSRDSLKALNLDIADQSTAGRPDGFIADGLNLACRTVPD